MDVVDGSPEASSSVEGDNRAGAEQATGLDGPRGPSVALYDASYGNFGEDVQAAVRRDAFGEDIGQNGWLTADEWRHSLGRLGVSASSRLLDVASGGGGPAVYAAVQ